MLSREIDFLHLNMRDKEKEYYKAIGAIIRSLRNNIQIKICVCSLMKMIFRVRLFQG